MDFSNLGWDTNSKVSEKYLGVCVLVREWVKEMKLTLLPSASFVILDRI